MEIIAPRPVKYLDKITKTVFLAGSIENGQDVWQGQVIQKLGNPENVLFLNPRREQWDAELGEDDNPVLREQIDWKFDGLNLADIVFFYLQPSTKSAIPLLELGLILNSSKACVVVCPKGFWKQPDVKITCERYGVPFFEMLNDGVKQLQILLKVV